MAAWMFLEDVMKYSVVLRELLSLQAMDNIPMQLFFFSIWQFGCLVAC